MKLSEAQIRQVIREELKTILNEADTKDKAALAIAAGLMVSYGVAIQYIQTHKDVAQSINKTLTQVSNDLRVKMGKEPIDYKLDKK
jgi:predicted component of type VI protein secretion system